MQQRDFFVERHLFEHQVGALVRREALVHPRASGSGLDLTPLRKRMQGKTGSEQQRQHRSCYRGAAKQVLHISPLIKRFCRTDHPINKLGLAVYAGHCTGQTLIGCAAPVNELVGYVIRLPHIGAQIFGEIGRILERDAFRDGLPGDSFGDNQCNSAGVGDGRQQRCIFVLKSGRKARESSRRGHEHGIGDGLRLRYESTESETWENIRIVNLRDTHFASVDFDRWEGAAGTDERAAFGPMQAGRRAPLQIARWDWRAEK